MGICIRTIVSFAILFLVEADAAAQTAVINIDSTKTYQRTGYWEAQRYASHNHPDYNSFKDEVYDRAVNEIGINRIRLEVRSGVEHSNDNFARFQSGQIDNAMWRCLRYSTVNDNTDPNSLNMGAFKFTEMDENIEASVLPMIAAMQARGEKLYILLNYVAFLGQLSGATCPSGLQYHHDDPKEYAEFVLAVFMHLKQKYGITPDAWEVILEPDNNNRVWGQNKKLIGEVIVETDKLLRAKGFGKPDYVAPSTLSMGRVPQYMDEINKVPGAMSLLDEVSYHRYSSYPYGSRSLALKALADSASHYGKKTYMSEYWSKANDYNTLHDDLKIGNVSAWQQSYIAQNQLKNAPVLWLDESTSPASLVTSSLTQHLTQYYRYIRQGALRIEATSANSNFDPLAFMNKDGSYVVVIKAVAAGNFTVGNLPDGNYEITYTTSQDYQKSMGIQTVSGGSFVSASIPRVGVLSIFQKGSPKPNQPKAPTNLRQR